MTICKKCDGQHNAHVSGAHSSLVRRGVIMRILDASETYDCLECGTGWERIQMAEDVRNVMYRWKVREGSSQPLRQVPTRQCEDLVLALDSWVRPQTVSQEYV
jgi:NADH:ubiquinone oxidoreductase subunit D